MSYKYKVLITEPIVEEVIEKLRREFQVDVGKRGEYNDESRLVEAIPRYDALLPMLSNPVTGRVIKAGAKLRIIANHAVGYNNIDLKAARRQNVKIANTPDVLTESTADFAMALLLGVARKVCESQQYLKNGRFNGWEPLGFLGMELRGKTLGILGMGRIGTAVARRARAFGMEIAYHNRNRVAEALEKELNARFVPDVKELAKQSDILSVNCPLTEETHHIIYEEVLDLMPKHSLLINTARGPIVDEAALAEALHEKRIGGAGIDVFEEEPTVHSRLLSAPNCILTPHIGSATFETRKAMGMLAADAIIHVLKGKNESEIHNLIPL